MKLDTVFKDWRSHEPIPCRLNFFVENNGMTSVMISKECELSGITGKYIHFLKINFFHQRDKTKCRLSKKK